MIEGAHSVAGEDGGDDHSGHGHLRFLQEDDHSGHDDHSEEGVNSAKWGCAVLGGFFLPFLLNIFFHRDEQDEAWAASGSIDKVVPDDAETGVPVSSATERTTRRESDISVAQVDEDVEQPIKNEAVSNLVTQMTSRTSAPVDRQLAASILIGDGFHNFADGLFVAAAFKSCSTSVAIGIALGERTKNTCITLIFAISITPLIVTLCHEIAQELADFIVLTNYCNMSTPKALLLNFVSGLSVMLVCVG